MKKRLLRSEDRVRLEHLMEEGETVRTKLGSARTELDGMEAEFPGLYGRLDVLMTQSERALSDSGRSLQALDVEGSKRMVSYSIDSLSGALVVLDEAARPASRSALVAAGGGTAAGGVNLEAEKDLRYLHLVESLEQAGDTGLPPEWHGVVEDYFRRLAQ